MCTKASVMSRFTDYRQACTLHYTACNLQVSLKFVMVDCQHDTYMYRQEILYHLHSVGSLASLACTQQRRNHTKERLKQYMLRLLTAGEAQEK